jgi:hypothetical protein
MNHTLRRIVPIAGMLLAAAAFAQTSAPPAGAPAGSAGQCKDGTYSMAAKKSGACSGHQGVQTWWGASTATAPAAAPAPAPAAAAAPAPTPAPAAAPAAASSPPASAAVGPGDEWYGKTKQGQYMSEADAKAAGNRPAHGKTCS